MEQSFWSEHGNEVSAAITLAVSILIAIAVDRFLFGRAEKAAEKVDTATFSREARTRLRVVRRLVFLMIIIIGVALALSQFADIKRFATGILASTAVLGVVIGFAGRQVFANIVAGMLMAITQPLRIGDRVTVGEHTGRVFDIALTYTTIDTGEGQVVVVPNERLVTEPVVNHTAGDRRAPAIASLWLAPGADIEEARQALRETEATNVRLAEVTQEGARLELRAELPPGTDRQVREGEILEAAQASLRRAGVLS